MGVVFAAGRILFNVGRAGVKFGGAATCAAAAGSYLATAHRAPPRANSPKELQNTVSQLALATLLMGVSTALSASARRSLTHKRQWRVTGGITFLLQAASSVGAPAYGYRNNNGRTIGQLKNIFNNRDHVLLAHLSGYSIFQQTLAQGVKTTLLGALSDARMELLKFAAQTPPIPQIWHKQYIETDYQSHLTWIYGGSRGFANQLSLLATGLQNVPNFDQKPKAIVWLETCVFEIRNGSQPQQDLNHGLMHLQQNIQSVSPSSDNTLLLQIKALLDKMPQNTAPAPVDNTVEVHTRWQQLLQPASDRVPLVTEIQTNLNNIRHSCDQSTCTQVTAINKAITSGHQEDSENFLAALRSQLPALRDLKLTRPFGQDAQRKLIAQIETLLAANPLQQQKSEWSKTYFKVTDGTIRFNTESSHDSFDTLFYAILTSLTELKNDAQDKEPFTQLITQLESMQEDPDDSGFKYFKNDQDTLDKLPTILQEVQVVISQTPTGLSKQLTAQIESLIAANFPT
ncbi:hypothetical protein COB21_00010 [Candidatus Aerophobetes bacterium]|uniref:Uncharacterized protein n=1 Tax=Aerophobetes bacterium TaxID=2030807 RepID=A0A2A4X7W6_UNCAE|nr:MAG: hypothetical protein COB21_00010 [Candidatus Aerophobetes bacterium]